MCQQQVGAQLAVERVCIGQRVDRPLDVCHQAGQCAKGVIVLRGGAGEIDGITGQYETVVCAEGTGVVRERRERGLAISSNSGFVGLPGRRPLCGCRALHEERERIRGDGDLGFLDGRQ